MTSKETQEEGRKGRVASNFMALAVMQVANYLLPLLLFPYLARTLGVENFGLLAFATATIGIFRAIVAYGFDLSSVRDISIRRHDMQAVSEVVVSVVGAKVLLCVATFATMLLLIVVVPAFSDHKLIFVLTFLVIVGDVLFPAWLFQGMEVMKIITYARLAYKLVFAVLVLILVRSERDAYLVPLIDGLGAIVMGWATLLYSRRRFGLIFSMPCRTGIVAQLKSSKHIFLSNAAVLFYSSFNMVVLGMLTSNVAVGYYSIAEKIYSAIRGMLNPAIQAVFPFLARKHEGDRATYYGLIRRISLLFFVVLALSALATYFCSHFLVRLVSGEASDEAVETLKIFAIALAFAIGGLYSTLLVIKGEGRLLSRITGVSMVLNLAIIGPAVAFLGSKGGALAFLLVQLVQAALQIYANREVFKR